MALAKDRLPNVMPESPFHGDVYIAHSPYFGLVEIPAEELVKIKYYEEEEKLTMGDGSFYWLKGMVYTETTEGPFDFPFTHILKITKP